MPLQHTPLAWKNLTHDHRRLAVALSGVGFAVVLMFMEMGFENALFDSTVAVLRQLDADLLMVSKAHYSLTSGRRFDRARIEQASSCDGVYSASALYIESFAADWKPPGGRRYPIRVLAYDLDQPVLRIDGLDQLADQLRAPGTALIDRKSKPPFQFPKTAAALRALRGGELSRQSIRLVGAFSLGTDFANDGTLVMSDTNFARYFSHRNAGADPLSGVDMGVVRIKPGRDPQVVRRRLQRRLPADVNVFTKDELIAHEIAFWKSSTPIGYIFAVGTIMGFVVGVVICYQIIHANIADHLPELATLKAMGYRNRYFIALVLRQSLYLSVLGFAPALAVAWICYQSLAATTGLLMELTVARAAMVLLLTTAMCGISGILAMRKVFSADPADLF